MSRGSGAYFADPAFLWLTAAAFSAWDYYSYELSRYHHEFAIFLVVMPIGFTSSTYFPESELVLIQLASD